MTMGTKFWPGIIVGAIGILILLCLAGYVAVRAGAMPANADGKPGAIERWAARTSLNATIKREMPKQPNPVALTDNNLVAGMKLYEANCSVCHGNLSGKTSNLAKGFYQRAPQLPKHGVEDDPEGETYWKITHGIRFTAMPAFGKTLTDEQRWKITLFLKHMDRLPAAVSHAWRKFS